MARCSCRCACARWAGCRRKCARAPRLSIRGTHDRCPTLEIWARMTTARDSQRRSVFPDQSPRAGLGRAGADGSLGGVPVPSRPSEEVTTLIERLRKLVAGAAGSNSGAPAVSCSSAAAARSSGSSSGSPTWSARAADLAGEAPAPGGECRGDLVSHGDRKSTRWSRNSLTVLISGRIAPVGQDGDRRDARLSLLATDTPAVEQSSAKPFGDRMFGGCRQLRVGTPFHLATMRPWGGQVGIVDTAAGSPPNNVRSGDLGAGPGGDPPFPAQSISAPGAPTPSGGGVPAAASGRTSIRSTSRKP